MKIEDFLNAQTTTTGVQLISESIFKIFWVIFFYPVLVCSHFLRMRACHTTFAVDICLILLAYQVT